MKKLLFFGIIALFIGLAFIPSFNAVSISKDIEETNPVVDDSEEDCIKCQSNGKTHLAEKLLIRLEKDEVSSDVINLDNLQSDRPLCDYLYQLKTNLYTFFFNYIDWAVQLNETNPDIGHIFVKLINSLYNAVSNLNMMINVIGALLFCDWVGPYYP